jgi:hypothetical protein
LEDGDVAKGAEASVGQEDVERIEQIEEAPEEMIFIGLECCGGGAKQRSAGQGKEADQAH